MEGSGQSNSEDEDQFTSNLLPLAKRPSDASQSGDDSMGVPTMNIASPKGFVTHEVSRIPFMCLINLMFRSLHRCTTKKKPEHKIP